MPRTCYLAVTPQNGAPPSSAPTTDPVAAGGSVAASKMRFSPSSPPDTRPRATRTRQRDNARTRYGGQSNYGVRPTRNGQQQNKNQKKTSQTHLQWGRRRGAAVPALLPCCLHARARHGLSQANQALRRAARAELTYRSWARAEARAARHRPRCWPSRPRWRGAGPWRAGPCPLAWRAASWWCSARGAACRTAGGYPAADPGRARASRPGR